MLIRFLLMIIISTSPTVRRQRPLPLFHVEVWSSFRNREMDYWKYKSVFRGLNSTNLVLPARHNASYRPRQKTFIHYFATAELRSYTTISKKVTFNSVVDTVCNGKKLWVSREVCYCVAVAFRAVPRKV